MSPSSLNTRTIAGYTLLDRIGAGGYGEVWKAEAPGGLTKAVKLIYGYLGDERADCEQKSLQRIKEVRHPFLLSLERIEIVDGQLVIVTELADASMKDRFEECCRAGMQGIPRDELLDYLSDVADALDYIRVQHSLQHLDVKPENILMLSGHAKIGDFGLVKQVQDHSVSIMGGMTPIYSAPEIFDGHPSLSSDQYSLAIVYQEMLTGAPPFPGRTPAQLAVQHARAEPRLGPLHPAERGTIARALAKKPEARFPSCRALIYGLMDARQSDNRHQKTPSAGNNLSFADTVSAASGRDDTASNPRPAELVITEPVPGGPFAKSRDDPPAVESAMEERQAAPRIVDLPPMECSTDASRPRPALVIGIGGTGSCVLRQLRGKLADRDGDTALPAVRLLLLDTDQDTIHDATRGDPRTALAMGETLALPLRRPQQYRNQAHKHLAWLSRRWLYNIPRSLKTQGFRPLGRLALMDHAEAVRARIHEDLAAATAPEVPGRSAQASGMAPDDRTPRIYVVASISGGTGSGMVLDLAAMARQVLAQLGFSHEYLVGILVHSTDHQSEKHDLAIANAFACCSELHHYQGIHRYHDQMSPDPPVSDQQSPTFHHTYLVPLGDKLGREQFHAAADSIAQYLYLNAVAPASLFFDMHRKMQNGRGRSGGDPYLRTFGLARIGCVTGDLPAVVTEAVCRKVVTRWRGDKSVLESGIERAAEELRDSLQLDFDSLVTRGLRIVSDTLGEAPEDFFRKQISKCTHDETPVRESMQRTLDKLLGRFETVSNHGSMHGELAAVLARSLDEIASNCSVSIVEWLTRQVDNSSASVISAQQGIEWFTDCIQSLETAFQQSSRSVQQKIGRYQVQFAESETANHKKKKSGKRWIVRHGHGLSKDHAWLECCQLRLLLLVYQRIHKALGKIHRRIVSANDRFVELSRTLAQLEDQFTKVGEPDSFSTPTALPGLEDRARSNSIHCRMDSQIGQIAAQVELEIRKEFFAEFSMWEMFESQRDLTRNLPDLLRKKSRAAVLRTLRHLNEDRFVSDSNSSLPDAAAPFGDSLANAEPILAVCGGARRFLMVAPSNNFSQLVSTISSPTPTVLFDVDADLTFCYEMEQIPLRQAAFMLIDNRIDYQQVANRLHTRIDISWEDFESFESAKVQPALGS